MKIMTAKEIAKLIVEDNVTLINFTFDDNTDDPCGWYGIHVYEKFDEHNLILGYWGGGIVNYETVEDWDTDNIEQAIENMWNSEMNVPVKRVCVDDKDIERRNDK